MNDRDDKRWEAQSFDSEEQEQSIYTRRQRASRRKKNSRLRIAGALAVFMAVIVGLSFAGAAIVRTITGDVEQTQTQNQGSAAAAQVSQLSSDEEEIAQVEVTSLTGTSESGIQITDVSDVVSAAMPAVVSITSRSLVSSYQGWPYQMAQTSEEVDSGVGSGTIVGYNDEELLILTSYHVVEGCSSLYVTFCDDSALDGYIKDISADDDIAVVAVRLDDISVETLNNIAIASINNDENEIGEGVIVIGDALGYGQSVVTGIISALDRQITVEDKSITVIQTDAAINSGNSGGCMLNSEGEIIGISEAKISLDAVEGMCYAISIQYYYDTIMDMLSEEPLDEDEIVYGDVQEEETYSFAFRGPQGMF